MDEKRIGIFRASDLVADANGDVLFFGRDLAGMLKMLHVQASDLSDAEHKGFATPVDGLKGVRIGEVVVLPVDGDDSIYEITTDDGEDVETAEKRSPSGDPGEWAVQSLIFSKDDFTLEQARKWISDHNEFADYGVDDTDASYRFRQYDPEHFSKFRTIDITEGVKGIYGQIAEAKRDDADQAHVEADTSIAEHETVKALNEDIVKRGVRLLPGTGAIAKVDEETEERFILGLVLEPNDGDDGTALKPDTQGDVYSRASIRKTAHGWMERYGAVDLMHSWEALGAASVAILESYLAPVDFPIGEGDDQYKVAKGTWLLALRILDEKIWQEIKSGAIGAFSVGGMATRTPLDDADAGEE